MGIKANCKTMPKNYRYLYIIEISLNIDKYCGWGPKGLLVGRGKLTVSGSNLTDPEFEPNVPTNVFSRTSTPEKKVDLNL